MRLRGRKEGERKKKRTADLMIFCRERAVERNAKWKERSAFLRRRQRVAKHQEEKSSANPSPALAQRRREASGDRRTDTTEEE